MICAVITSNIRLANAPGNVLLKESDSNLSKVSVVNVSQIITIDKLFLTECVGTISKGLLQKVKDRIKLVLDL